MNRNQVHQYCTLLVVSMLSAACLTRLFLFLMPAIGGGIAGIHVHHLMNGILLMTLGGIPAILIRSDNRVTKASVSIFGFGLGLALDEWLLLIVRESNPGEPYQSPVSLLGAVLLLALAGAYSLLICSLVARRDTRP